MGMLAAMANRIVPMHARNAVRRAGAIIASGSDPKATAQAREVLSNFRSSHGYPLIGVTVYVRKRALSVSPHAIVARRLKRLPTIVDKLERYPHMNVTTMQDLGGCRVVLDNVADVDLLVNDLVSSTRAQNKVVRHYDYIREEPGPKESGYRGVHLVYEYHASQREYDGLRVELQVRTSLQHAWATAVETMDLFSGSELKYSKGDPRIRRYFAVVSSLMAIAEGTPQVPGALDDEATLRSELRQLEADVGVISRLQGYTAIVSQHAQSNRRSALTLELKRREGELRVVVHETTADAERRLSELEALDDDNLDAVLVGITQIGQLQSAYPNYYADTSSFTDFVQRAVS